MSLDLSEFEKDNTINHIVQSGIPEICKTEPCCFGIDEAGRGPVLGPMVYGICYCPISQNERLAEMGFADSKTLSEEQREELFSKIDEAKEFIGYKTEIISPNFISNCMLQRSKCSLNEVSKNSAIGLLRLTLEHGVNVTEVYVDTVGDAKKYQDYLKGLFPDLEITVTPKADAKFPIVSAASICAKVCRDRAVKSWKFHEDLECFSETPYGSGYPNDPATKKWLAGIIDPVFGFPQFVRFSWSTADKILEENAVPVFWEDEDEDEQAKGTPSLHNFFGAKGSDPRKKKHHFFTERNIKPVTDF